jgi:prenyl protein peptidase
VFAPVAFGLAHAHHYFAKYFLPLHVQFDPASYNLRLFLCRRAQGYSAGNAAAFVAFQLLYTTAFGSIAAAVFLSCRSLAVTSLVHTFCNWQGLPDVTGALTWPNRAQRALLLAAYAVGPLAFFALLGNLVSV